MSDYSKALLVIVAVAVSLAFGALISGKADMRVINGTVTRTEEVTTYSFLEKDDWFTATIAIERPELSEVEFHEYIGRVVTYNVDTIRAPEQERSE